MLAGALNTNLYPEWIDYISSNDVKQAFVLIIGVSACLKTYNCHPRRKGNIRDFRFINDNDEQVFAFIVNRESLLFYFRKAAIQSNRYGFEAIKSTFPHCEENRRGEWTVKISNFQDAGKLLSFLELN